MVDGQLLANVPKQIQNKGHIKGHQKPCNSLDGLDNPKDMNKKQRPNMLATLASTYNFFSFLFNFVLLETWVVFLLDSKHNNMVLLKCKLLMG